MRNHMQRYVPMVLALVGGLALLVAASVVALEVRSVVAGPGADPGGPVPNPGHAWSEMQDHGVDGVTGDYWLGTTDPHALELRVNGSRALRLEPGGSSPNVIGGHSENSATAGAEGAAICGGGMSGSTNRVTDDYGSVGGGKGNRAGNDAGDTYDRPFATVGGGGGNTASGPSATVGGGNTNTAGEGTNATVGGGANNIASGFEATVGGGNSNTASGVSKATVAGGGSNTASGDSATVGGGGGNTASGDGATVGGGGGNTASNQSTTVGGGANNIASDDQATVSGGGGNTAIGVSATVGGGDANTAGVGTNATVGGGHGNIASGSDATVGGGNSNTASGYATTVGGGHDNEASADQATVAGGSGNTASSNWDTVGGGEGNTASGWNSTVGGGYHNTASGLNATVPGGASNTAAGAWSFAAGRQAVANNQGCFVWGDITDSPVECNDDNRFIARASGGVYLYTKSDLTTGAYFAGNGGARFDVNNSEWVEIRDDGTNLINTSAGAPGASLTIGGIWTDASSRDQKENFTPVDGSLVLARLADVPITTWNSKAQDASIRHMGPTAQDFYAAFGLGEDDLHIAALDSSGVALAAIQGLHQIVQELQAENANLKAQLGDLEARVTALEAGAGTSAASAEPAFPGLSPWWLALLGGVVVVGLVLAQRRLAGGRR